MPYRAAPFLNVSDLSVSLDFYRKLGFVVDRVQTTDDGVPGYAELSLGGAALWLGDLRADPDEEFQAWVSTPLGAGVMLNYEVPNVKPIWGAAKRAKATIDIDLTDMDDGARLFAINDPDGYVVGFWSTKKTATRKAAKRPGKTPAKRAKTARKPRAARAR